MKKSFLFTTLFIVLIVNVYSINPPDRIYSLQLGAYKTENEANGRKAYFEQAGYSPIIIEFKDNWYKVRFGEFACYIDAYLYKQDFQKGLCPDTWIVWQDNIDKKNDFSSTRGALEKILGVADRSVSEWQDNSINPNDPDVVAINALLQSNNQGLEQKLTEVILSRLDNDPVKGWAMMQIGKIKVDRGERAEVKDLFMQIARGDVAAPKNDRMDAMFRVARIHHSLKERDKAYRAYKEIENLVTDTKNKIETLVELAGLTFELSLCEKGQMKETRRVCQQVIETAPEELKQLRALAELINLETYIWTKEYDKGLQMEEEFEKKYKDQVREYGVAICVKGIFLCHLRRYEEAKATFYRVNELPENMEWFKDFNPKAFGEIFYASLSNSPEVNLQKVLEKYKDTLIAQKYINAQNSGNCLKSK